MSDNNTDRYEDILKRIAERRPFGSQQRRDKPETPHDRVLDLINAYDSFADQAQRNYEQILCYGPKHIRGAAWSAVVIWYRPKGYHGYRTLHLLGVWAHYRDEDIVISIGQRELPYRAPIFDPSVFRVAVENHFDTYYGDNGHPPGEADSLHYQSVFETEKRLQHRKALDDILRGWQRKIEAL